MAGGCPSAAGGPGVTGAVGGPGAGVGGPGAGVGGLGALNGAKPPCPSRKPAFSFSGLRLYKDI